MDVGEPSNCPTHASMEKQTLNANDGEIR